jgi:hypothetical protein
LREVVEEEPVVATVIAIINAFHLKPDVLTRVQSRPRTSPARPRKVGEFKVNFHLGWQIYCYPNRHGNGEHEFGSIYGWRIEVEKTALPAMVEKFCQLSALFLNDGSHPSYSYVEI